jgi:hypothetical protein
MKHKLKDKVLFVHPRYISFFNGVIIAKVESDISYRDQPKGLSYMIELTNKSEIHYVEERFVFTDLDDAKQNIFKALQGIR